MAPKLKTCAKGIVENIVGEPRLGTPTAWPSKECMRPRGAAARAGGGGTAAGAVNMAPKLKTCAKGIVDSIVGNRVRERQPGTAWPNAGARPGMSSGTSSGHIVGSNVSGTARSGTSNVSREHRQFARPGPTPSGTSPGTPAGASSRPGQQRLACVRGRLCCAVQSWLCSLHSFSTLGRWNLIFLRYWFRAAPGNPLKACSARFQGSRAPRKSWPNHFRSRRLCVLLENRRSCLDLVEPGSLVASGSLVAL